MTRQRAWSLLTVAAILTVLVAIGAISTTATAAEITPLDTGIETSGPEATLSQQDICGTTGIAAEFGHAGGSGLWSDIHPSQVDCLEIWACHITCNPGGCWRTCWYVGQICW